jgi:hypothetical protein
LSRPVLQLTTIVSDPTFSFGSPVTPVGREKEERIVLSVEGRVAY